MYFAQKTKTYYAALLCVTVCFGFFVANAHAIEAGGVGGHPANPRPDVPRSERHFIHTLNAGDEQQEEILVVNSVTEEKTVLVDAVDGALASGGVATCAQKLDVQKSVGTWITLEENELVLEANSTQKVPFTIQVPEDTVPGEYNGCIVIQEKKENTEKGGGITFSTRIGVRVIITVPGQFVRELSNPTVDLIIKEDGNYLFKTSVENNGTVSIDADIDVVIKSLFGIVYEEFGTTLPILRETKADWNPDINKPFWGGPYWVSTTFSYDSTGDGINDVTQTIPDIYLLVVPDTRAIAIEVGAVLAIIILLIMLMRRSGRKRRVRRNNSGSHDGSTQ